MDEKDIDLNHESRISKLEESVRQVCDNHIPHLWDAIKEIRIWIRGIGMAIAIMLLGFVVDYFLRK